MNVDAGMATGETPINPAERIETYESGLFNSSQYSGKWNSGIVAENMDAYKRLVEEKKILYMKNVLLSTPAYVGGGLAGTLLSSLFTDSPAAISLSYIVGQEAIGTSAFWLLHVNDNKDLYFEKAGKFYRGVSKELAALASSYPLERMLALGAGFRGSFYFVGI